MVIAFFVKTVLRLVKNVYFCIFIKRRNKNLVSNKKYKTYFLIL